MFGLQSKCQLWGSPSSGFLFLLNFVLWGVFIFLVSLLSARKKDVFSIPPRIFNCCGKNILGRGKLGCVTLLQSALGDKKFFFWSWFIFLNNLTNFSITSTFPLWKYVWSPLNYELFLIMFKCFVLFYFAICLSATDLIWGYCRMCKWLLFGLFLIPKYTILKENFKVKLTYVQKLVLRNGEIWNKFWGNFTHISTAMNSTLGYNLGYPFLLIIFLKMDTLGWVEKGNSPLISILDITILEPVCHRVWTRQGLRSIRDFEELSNVLKVLRNNKVMWEDWAQFSVQWWEMMLMHDGLGLNFVSGDTGVRISVDISENFLAVFSELHAKAT